MSARLPLALLALAALLAPAFAFEQSPLLPSNSAPSFSELEAFLKAGFTDRNCPSDASGDLKPEGSLVDNLESLCGSVGVVLIDTVQTKTVGLTDQGTSAMEHQLPVLRKAKEYNIPLFVTEMIANAEHEDAETIWVKPLHEIFDGYHNIVRIAKTSASAVDAMRAPYYVSSGTQGEGKFLPFKDVDWVKPPRIPKTMCQWFKDANVKNVIVMGSFGNACVLETSKHIYCAMLNPPGVEQHDSSLLELEAGSTDSDHGSHSSLTPLDEPKTEEHEHHGTTEHHGSHEHQSSKKEDDSHDNEHIEHNSKGTTNGDSDTERKGVCENFPLKRAACGHIVDHIIVAEEALNFGSLHPGEKMDSFYAEHTTLVPRAS